MKRLLIILVILTIIGCKKDIVDYKSNSNTNTTNPISVKQAELDFFSNINKTTSWYINNKSFEKILSLSSIIPTNISDRMSGTENDLGGYIYTDLNGDNKKDLFVYRMKSPWPTNEIGLNLFMEYEKDISNFDIQNGLTQIRKLSLADLDKDGNNEVVCFSSGYDKMPFPGDSIQIFYPKQKKYKYLSDDIGYFHTGATGDINNDGFIDIVAYSGWSQNIKTHAVCYLNDGKNLNLKKDVFKTINEGVDNFYTIELFDINNDGWLDAILSAKGKLTILYNNKSGYFDKRIDLNLKYTHSLGLDIGFFDLDNNGKVDLIINSVDFNYNGYNISTLLQFDNNEFKDYTNQYINECEETGTNTWIKWLRFFDYDKDGDIDLVGDGLYGNLFNKKIWWKNDNNKFTKSN